MQILEWMNTPVYFLLLSSFLNIVLDFVTVLVFDMGVGGPALATVVSQGVSAVLCFLYMRKNYPILKLTEEEKKFHPELAKVLCSMGIPMGLQYSITAIGSVVLQTAVNSLGSLAVAAVATGSKVSMFFCSPFDALGGTMATYAGQNVGAKKMERVKDGLICNSAFYFPLTLVNVVRFAIQGMGFSMFAILAGVCEMIARSFWGFVLVPMFGFGPVCFGNPAAWIAADLFLVPAFWHCYKKLKIKFGE